MRTTGAYVIIAMLIITKLKGELIMPSPNLNQIRMKIHFEKPVPAWWRVAYLIPDMFHNYQDILKDASKILEGKDLAFNKFVQGHVQAFIQKGVKPPEHIAGPILNIAEDIMAGREPVIRAGDYIALQTQMRANR